MRLYVYLLALMMGVNAWATEKAMSAGINDNMQQILSIDVSESELGDLSVEELKKLVSEGNSEAQFRLAWRYARGNGVEKSDKKAFLLWEKAANQGDLRSMFRLGELYYKHQNPEEPNVRYNIDEISDKEAAQRSFFWYEKV